MVTSPSSQARFAIRFFVVSVVVLTAALGLGRAFAVLLPPALWPDVQFPPAFAASTVAVLLGSHFLSRGLAAVRRERQVLFRQQLLLALIAGGLFVSLQVAAINWLLQRQRPEDAQTSATAFVAVMAALHALHFAVAMLFLVYVWLKAHNDRYDHEYYWGVLVCAWFWHALSVAWIAVLAVVGIATHGV
jgi:cytochrome c oxidase subunit 3